MIYLLDTNIVSYLIKTQNTALISRFEQSSKNATIGGYDMLIAAHALSLKATLITNNTREFERVNGLTLEDWTQAR